jgi:hypothetical protein
MHSDVATVSDNTFYSKWAQLDRIHQRITVFLSEMRTWFWQRNVKETDHLEDLGTMGG